MGFTVAVRDLTTGVYLIHSTSYGDNWTQSLHHPLGVSLQIEVSESAVAPPPQDAITKLAGAASLIVEHLQKELEYYRAKSEALEKLLKAP